MEKLFDICVDILYWIAEMTGWTYKEANIWLFVIIHPAMTLVLLYIAIKYRQSKKIINQLINSLVECTQNHN